MNALALDTSTNFCSAALYVGKAWYWHGIPSEQAHSQRLLAMAQQLLEEAELTQNDLNAIVFGAGPGSFTGLRIACGVAQGLALGLNLPVLGIDSLEALAEEAYLTHGATSVITALDARMGEIYLAAYQRMDEQWETVLDPHVTSPQKIKRLEGDNWFAAGDAFAAYPEISEFMAKFCIDENDSLVPTALAVGRLALPRLLNGEGLDPAEAQPIYLRTKVALTQAEQESRQPNL